MKIQKPSPGRVVHYTNVTGTPTPTVAIVDRVNDRDPSRVDLVAFHRPIDTADPNGAAIKPTLVTNVPFNSDGDRGTWRYPAHVKDEIEA